MTSGLLSYPIVHEPVNRLSVFRLVSGFLQVKPYAVYQRKGREYDRPHIQRQIIHRNVNTLDILRNGGHRKHGVEYGCCEFQEDDNKQGALAVFLIADLCRQQNKHGENSDPFDRLADTYKLVLRVIRENKALRCNQGGAKADNHSDMLLLFLLQIRKAERGQGKERQRIEHIQKHAYSREADPDIQYI